MVKLPAAGPFESLLAATVAMAMVATAGCSSWRGSAGELRTVSLGEQSSILPSRFTTSYFAPDRNGSTTFMLADASLDSLLNNPPQSGQILHVELLWNPLPGRTPMDPSATNASFRLIVFVDGRVGIYSGAGFALPYGDPQESDSLTITVRDATLQLEEATAGFADALGVAQMTGTFTARRDEKKTRQLNQAASQMVTNALGRTRYVLNAR
jgi:hypothetical protein